MSTLSSEVGTDTVLRCLRILMLRLSGRSEAADIYTDVAAAHSALDAARQNHQTQLDRRIALSNELHYRDEEMDHEADKVYTRVLLKCDQDASDPRLRAVFTQTPSKALRSTADEGQISTVRAWLSAIAAQPDFASIPTADLTAAVNTFETTHQARRAQLSAEQAAWAALLSARATAIEVHNLAEPRLRVVYGNRKALVKSFFYRKERADAAEEAGEG